MTRVFLMGNHADETLAEGEELEFDGAWLHVVRFEGPLGSMKVLRSYPAHMIAAVLYR